MSDPRVLIQKVGITRRITRHVPLSIYNFLHRRIKHFKELLGASAFLVAELKSTKMLQISIHKLQMHSEFRSSVRNIHRTLAKNRIVSSDFSRNSQGSRVSF